MNILQYMELKERIIRLEGLVEKLSMKLEEKAPEKQERKTLARQRLERLGL